MSRTSRLASKRLARALGVDLGLLPKDAFDVVDIDVDDIDREYGDLPGEVMRWGLALARAEGVSMDAKHDLDIVSARVRAARKQQGGSGGRGLGVDELKMWVTLDPSVKDARRLYEEAEKRVHIVKAVCDALEVKRDSLVGLGAQLRREMDR